MGYYKVVRVPGGYDCVRVNEGISETAADSAGLGLNAYLARGSRGPYLANDLSPRLAASFMPLPKLPDRLCRSRDMLHRKGPYALSPTHTFAKKSFAVRMVGAAQGSPAYSSLFVDTLLGL